MHRDAERALTMRPTQGDYGERFGRALGQAKGALHGERPDPLQQAKDELAHQIEGPLALLREQRAQLRATAPNDPQLAAIERREGDLQALLQQVEQSGNLATIAQLKHQIAESTRAATDTAQAVQASGVGVSAAGNIALHMASAETRRLLTEGSARITERAGEMLAWGKQYGVDLSEQEERERELKKKEQELRDKGDIVGALGIHGDRLRNQISGYDELLDSDKVPPAAKDRIAARRRQSLRELESVNREREAQDKGAGGHGQATRRTAEAEAALTQVYGGSDLRTAQALERRADEKKLRLGTDAQQGEGTRTVTAAQKEEEAAVGMKQRDTAYAALGAASDDDMQLALAAPDAVKAQAKQAAIPAAAAGAADSSKTADLSGDAKPAPVQTADAGKPQSGRGAAV
ncbi:hypothetical protein MWN34_10610 [Ancylobacter sp. 6x-1]|uniref:Uncharacterized protein n=1 Tax=Ancylobacter crimeensis TaxID=2579147 RepID=A0ABT0DBN2_9HYPH|nr:hypothetical protein [Ancylobacter crimeensis]MCK0197363.1 hypothetical protein [Ancylobacter crimeensis]